MEKDIRDEITKLPHYVEIPEGVFRDISHYKRVLHNIIKALARGKAQKSGGHSSSFLFDGLEIEFSRKITIEKIFLDHLRSKIVLKAPVIKGENVSDKRKRTMFYHGHLLKSVEAMKTIGITTIYLTITKSGRNKLAKGK